MPRIAAENQRIRDERHKHLLHAAAHLFARKGLKATTIAEIAAAAQVSHGLAYHYFPNKEEIFRQLVIRAMEGSERLLQTAYNREGTPAQRLHWLIEAMVEGVSNSANEALIVQQAVLSEAVSPDVRELVLQKSPLVLAYLSRLLHEGQNCGEVIPGDPNQLATLLLSCIQGISANKALDIEQYKPEPEVLLRLFLAR